jgi:hypothetical protein
MSKKKSKSCELPLTKSSDLLCRKRAGDKKYTLCVATYYENPEEKENISRITAALMDIEGGKDKLVSLLEFWDMDDMDEALDQIMDLAKKYDVTIILLSEPVKLEKCSHCVSGYLSNCITSKDLQKWNELNQIGGSSC